MGGDLSYVLNDTRRAFATPAVSGGAAATVGVGLAPEGIDNSAVRRRRISPRHLCRPHRLPSAAAAHASPLPGAGLSLGMAATEHL